MTDTRKTMQEVVDAFDAPNGLARLCEAIDKLREALAQQSELGNASKSEQLLASYDHAVRAEFKRTKAALAQQGEQQSVPFTPDWTNYRQGFEDGKAEALAQQGEQKPMAWCELSLDGTHIAFFDGKPIIMVGPVGNDCHKTPLYAGAAPAVQHPTIEQVLNCYSPDDTATDYQNKLIDLFKAAPAAQPLTDEVIDELSQNLAVDDWAHDFTRRIERMHGIGADK